MAKKTKRSPVLELSSDIERDYVLIDGKECSIKNKQELSIVDLHRIQRRYKSIHKLLTQDELNDEELANLQNTIDEFIDFIFVDVPKETLDKLIGGQKMEIFTVFTNLFLENQPERVKKEIEKLAAEMAAEAQKKEAAAISSETAGSQ